MRSEEIKSYFTLMQERQWELVKNVWLPKQKPSTKRQQKFLAVVEEATRNIGYDYRIANIEPSINKDGEIYYQVDEDVAALMSFEEWQALAWQYSRENASRLATLNELFLWYAYRVARGKWTLSYVCDDSSPKGNYADSPKATHCFEKTAFRSIGGECDGIGNTFKIVTNGKKQEYLLCSGCYKVSGKEQPVADIRHASYPFNNAFFGVGVIVLTK